MVSSAGSSGPAPGAGYVFVDHGDEFRRQHAEAFPVETTGITIASSEWAIDHLLRNGGSGYLARRHVAALLAANQLAVVPDAPVFGRRVYVVESAPTVRKWDWYQSTIAAVFKS